MGRSSGAPARVLHLGMVMAMLMTVVGLAAGRADALPCSPLTCPGDGDDGGGGGNGGGGGGGGGDTGTTLTTPTASVDSRTGTSLLVGWVVPDSATSYDLEHLDGSSWTPLHHYSGHGVGSFEHTGLAPDTRQCYRVVAARSGTTKTSWPACAYTDATSIFRNIWRVEVQVTTGDVENADTDDNVRASIFGPINGTTGGGAYLDHAGDDFEQGQTHRYDMVNLVGIDDLDDIESLQLYKGGSDDWCVKDVSVLVNNTLVFTTSFGPPCQWVFESDLGPEPINISHEQLRSYPLWHSYQIPLSSILQGNEANLVIGHDQIEGTIETQVGDKMVGTDGYWAPPDAVHVTPYDSQRAKVDLDLRGRSFGSDVGVDVDFDLVAGTHKDMQGNWVVDVTTANASASVDPAFWQWFFVAMSAGAELSIPEEGIESALSGVAAHNTLGAVCDVTATFDDAANLVIHATLVCPPP